MCSEQELLSSDKGLAGAWFGCQCKQCCPAKSNRVVGQNISCKVSEKEKVLEDMGV